MTGDPNYPTISFDLGDAPPDPDTEAGKAYLAELQDANDDLDQAMLAAFRTKAGKVVLAWLRNAAVAPGFDPDLGYENGVAAGFAREGQTMLVREITMRMKRATESRR